MTPLTIISNFQNVHLPLVVTSHNVSMLCKPQFAGSTPHVAQGVELEWFKIFRASLAVSSGGPENTERSAQGLRGCRHSGGGGSRDCP